MGAPELLADLYRRGFAVRAANGQLVVTPASALTAADRIAIRRVRAGLLRLTVGAEWDPGTASRLMYDADTLVGELGVSGLHPAVQDAAGSVYRANLTENMTALRVAVSVFVAVVRGLAPCSAPEADDGAAAGAVGPAQVSGCCRP